MKLHETLPPVWFSLVGNISNNLRRPLPLKLQNSDEIIEHLRPHISDISFRTDYRRRKEAVEALSSVLWGYTTQDNLRILRELNIGLKGSVPLFCPKDP